MAQHPGGPSRYHGASLHLDPLIAQTDEEASNASPSSATTSRSPVTPFFRNIPASREAEGLDIDAGKKPSSGPQRSAPGSATKADKEKRKRSRVTPEQLVHLERYFAQDRNPTAARRRDISDLLGMQERQTQIWFQNRRAKAKLLDGKQMARGDDLEVPPDTPPELSTGFEAELHSLIHEDEPVIIIPCTDLTVGSWRRIASSPAKHDLVAYVCEVKRCLTWFIHSGGYGFKMEIPFSTIIDTEFKNASPSSGLASFVLSQPPIFYLENVSSPRSDGSVVRTWRRCSDWTEGHQATNVLRHTLIGSAVQLAHVLRNLHSNVAMPDIAVVPPPVMPPSHRPNTLISRPMDLPPPPLAGRSGANYAYPGLEMKNQQFERIDRSRKRPSYGTMETQYFGGGDLRSPPQSTLALTQPPPHPYMPPTRPVSNIPTFEPTLYNSYQPNLYQGSGTSTLSAQPQLYYNSNPRILQSFQHGDGRMQPTSNISRPMEYTPSPPLLMSPYHHDPNRRLSEIPNPPSPQTLAGMPGFMYDIDTDIHRRRSG